MKNITTFFLLTLLLALPTLSQKKEETNGEQSIKRKDVPSVILAAFEKSYPKATVKGYTQEKKDAIIVYEVESMEGDTHRDVTYTSDGALVSVEESIPVNDLPEAVLKSLKKEYPKGKIEYCEKIMKGETLTYEVLLKSGKQKWEVVFDTEGKIVEKEKK
jgi:hypothetical protein